jgi:hypothetical protein
MRSGIGPMQICYNASSVFLGMDVDPAMDKQTISSAMHREISITLSSGTRLRYVSTPLLYFLLCTDQPFSQTKCLYRCSKAVW